MSSEKLIRKAYWVNLTTTPHLHWAQYYHHTIHCSCYNWNLCKIVNIYHRYPNKIFIIWPYPYCILGVVSWLNYQFIRKLIIVQSVVLLKLRKYLIKWCLYILFWEYIYIYIINLILVDNNTNYLGILSMVKHSNSHHCQWVLDKN